MFPNKASEQDVEMSSHTIGMFNGTSMMMNYLFYAETAKCNEENGENVWDMIGPTHHCHCSFYNNTRIIQVY